MRIIKRVIAALFHSKTGRKTRQRVLAAVMALVVFCSVYSLILPAITLDTATAETEPGIEAALQPVIPVSGEEPEEVYAGGNGGEDSPEQIEGESLDRSEGDRISKEIENVPEENETETERETQEGTQKEAQAETDVPYARSPLTWHNDDLEVTLSFDERIHLPEDARLEVRLLEGQKESDAALLRTYENRVRKEMTDRWTPEILAFYQINLCIDGHKTALPAGSWDLAFAYHDLQHSPASQDGDFLAALFEADYEAETDDHTALLFDRNADGSAAILQENHHIRKVQIKQIDLSDYDAVIGFLAYSVDSDSIDTDKADAETHETGAVLPVEPREDLQTSALTEPRENLQTPALTAPLAAAGEPAAAAADVSTDRVSYHIWAEEDTAVAGTPLRVRFHAEMEGDGLLQRYVYVLMEEDQADCLQLAGLAAGGMVSVPLTDGGTVVLHRTEDGFWFAMNPTDGNTIDFDLDFQTVQAEGQEPEEALVTLCAGAGIFSVEYARQSANINKRLVEFGVPDYESAYVSLSWTAEEVDTEPVMEDAFSVTADEIYGYFHTRLPAAFHAVAGRGSENNVFYVRQSADRAVTDILKDTQPGDIVPAVDAAGNPITDRYGEQLQLHVTEDGFWFALDNSKHNNYADFSLTYQAAEGANEQSSNPAKMRLYLAQEEDEGTAKDAAGNKFSPNLSLTWSDSGDKLHYAINLIWDTTIEEDKYDQEVVTTSQATLQPKYILDLLTSSVNYEPGQFEMRLPYALWPYRGYENTGRSAAIPTDISIPKEGQALNGSMFQYRIEYDPDYPNDLTKAQLVITNAEYLPAGTNARITVKYQVDPWNTVDLSRAELTVLATAQAENQSSPEYGESNTITYRLDTGFNNTFLRKTSTWTSTEAAAVYTQPSGLGNDYWDPDHYNMVKFHINYGANGYNQPLDLDFLATLPEGAELVMVMPHTGTRPIAIDTETGTWERPMSSKSWSSSDGDYWFYVRFPRTGDGDADYHVRLDMDATTRDPDSHTPPEDYNDKDHQYLEWDFHWKDYEFKPVGTESYSKAGWGDDYIEAVKAGHTDVEFSWRMYVNTLRWYMEKGETQYIQATDDAHFWTYVPSYYGVNDYKNAKNMKWMTEDSWEFSRITSISLQYYDLSHRDGSRTYPDFPGGALTIQGSRDGVTWDTLQEVDVPAQAGRTSQYITVPDSGKYEFDKGTGYTRLRVISPEFGRGSLLMEVNFYTRMRADSGLMQQWLDECPDDQKVYIRNYAAYQHFTRSYETETVTDPETGEEKTVRTDRLGDYVWDDQAAGAYTKAVSDGAADGKTLADRDAEEDQYYDGSQTGYLRRAYANGILRHFTYSAQIQKKTEEVINDTPNQRAIVPFKIFEEEIITGKMGDQYTSIYQEFSQDSGVFYDLLPPGYRYMEGSADGQTATGLDAPVTVETIDDYRGSGRQMVLFHLTKPADPAPYTIDGDTNLKNQGYRGYLFGKTTETRQESSYTGNPHTGFMITFQAYVPWKELVSHPSEVNLVSFQRTDGQPIRAGYSDQGYPDRQRNFPSSDSQLIKEFKGTAATSRKIDYDKETTADFDEAFAAAGGVRASGPSVFTDVDGDGVITPKTSLYAYSTVNPQVVDGVQTGIRKRVLGDEGLAEIAQGGEGWRKLDRTTLQGHYQYKVTTRASIGEMYGLIVYDTLEDAKNKEGAEGEVTWKGTFDSVDVSEAKALGIAPVIYYSTATLDYNTITGDEEYIWIDDRSIWTTECPEDKSTVKAVAVDFRKMADGSDTILRSRSGEDDPDIDEVSFLINMIAPKYFPSDPEMIYAINRPAYSCYQKGFFSADGIFKNDIGLRVKIRLPITVRIRKTSRGAETPAGAAFTLTCPNGYKYHFTYADFEEGEFVFDDSKLAQAREDDPDNDLIPEYVEVGQYTLTEDAKSAAVGGLVPEILYDEGTNGVINIAGKTDDPEADAGEQNLIHIINSYGTDLQILKVDKTDGETPLAGAQFTLQRLDPDGKGTLLADTDSQTSGITGEDGMASFEKLAEGYYVLTESKVPDGYVIASDGDGSFYFRLTGGQITPLTKDVTSPVSQWQTSEKGGALDFDKDLRIVTLGNAPGAALPSTGGPGTAGLKLAGALLVCLAGLAGTIRRRHGKAASGQ